MQARVNDPDRRISGSEAGSHWMAVIAAAGKAGVGISAADALTSIPPN